MPEPPERSPNVHKRVPEDGATGPGPAPSVMSRKYRDLNRILPELAIFRSDNQRKSAMRKASSLSGHGSGPLWLWLALFLVATGVMIVLAPTVSSLHPAAGRIWLILIVPMSFSWLWLCRSVIRRRLRAQLFAQGVLICVKCGYDLRGSKDVCPECGQGF